VRTFRDPDSLVAASPSQHELKRIGFWSSIAREAMDAQFRLAMTAAIECGAEHCTTSPSTHFGTRAPIAGYQRD
jgi:hypothetical protein